MLSNRRKTNTETDVPSKIVGQNSDGSYRIMKGSDVGNNSNMIDTVNRIVDANARTTQGNLGMGQTGGGMRSSLDQIGGYGHMTEHNPQSNFVINVNSQTDGMVIVETDHVAKRFSFYNPQKNFIGSFSVFEFIKYVTSNVSESFLPTVDSYAASTIIEKYIGTVRRTEAPTLRFEIKMLNYVESPFMGNVETLVKFYTFISEFENGRLVSELNAAHISPDEATKIKDIFDLMVYTLLTHILKIIAALTNKIASNPGGDPAKIQEIKDSLLRYSVSIMYRLSKFVKKEVNQKLAEIDRLDEDLLRIQNIRSQLQTRLDSVQRAVDQQNTRIDYMIKSGMKTMTEKHTTPVAKVSSDIAKSEKKVSDDEIEAYVISASDVSEPEHASMTESSVLTSTLDKDAIVNPGSYVMSRDPGDIDTGIEDIIKNLDEITGESATNSTERGFIKDRPGQQIVTSAAQTEKSETKTESRSDPQTDAESESPAEALGKMLSEASSSAKSSAKSSTKTSDKPQSLEDLLMT